MSVEAVEKTGYREFIRLEEPVYIWTPDGYYEAPSLMDEDKMPVNLTLPEAIAEARKRKPRQRILTLGERYQIRENIRDLTTGISPVVKNMISGPYERTSTILDFVHGKKKRKWFDGLLIQIPELDDDGSLVTDEKGILKARHVWEMALPLGFERIAEMPPELDTFLHTAYGMEGVREKLAQWDPWVYVIPDGMINLFQNPGNWSNIAQPYIHIIDGHRPLERGKDMAARACSDDQVFLNTMK